MVRYRSNWACLIFQASQAQGGEVKEGKEEQQPGGAVRKIRITLTSTNVEALEKGTVVLGMFDPVSVGSVLSTPRFLASAT